MEARSYGLAVLATGGAALGWPGGCRSRRAGCCSSASPAPGWAWRTGTRSPSWPAFVVAALLLRGRRAVPVLLAGRPPWCRRPALVAVNLLNGTGARNAEHLRDTGGRLAELAVEAWTGGRTPCSPDRRPGRCSARSWARGVRVVGAAWLLVPLLLLLAAELVRPVYLPRYLLAGLLGLGVLAAAGALTVPRGPARVPVAALLLGCSLLASAPAARPRAPGAGRRRRAALLAELHRAGSRSSRPTSARRSGWTTTSARWLRELRPDVVLPPDDAPADADRVWLVRRLSGTACPSPPTTT